LSYQTLNAILRAQRKVCVASLGPWSAEQSAAASQQGWDIFHTGGAKGHALYEVEGLSEPPEGVDPITDRQAHLHVKRLIEARDPLGMAVVNFLLKHAPEELDTLLDEKHEGWT